MTRLGIAAVAALLLLTAPASATVRVEVNSGGLFIRDNNVTFDDHVRVGLVPKSNGDLEYLVGKSRICGFTCVELFLFEVGPGCRSGPTTETLLCNRNIAKVRMDARGGDDFFTAGGTIDGISTTMLPDPVTFNGAAGDDFAATGNGADSINLGSGDDVGFGNNGNDTIEGNDGDDTITLGFGADVVNGGAGDDAVRSETNAPDADDTIDGGEGFDTYGYDSGSASFTRSAPVLLTDRTSSARAGDDAQDESDHIENVERFRGGSAGDSFNHIFLQFSSLSSAPHTYLGLAGNDELIGTRGDNTIIGGANADDMRGLDGNDVLDGKTGETTAVKDTKVDCGAGTSDVAIVDLQDPDTQGCESVNRSPIGEGPHVRIGSPRVRGRKLRLRLKCPAALREPCAGTLRLGASRKRYSIAPGRRKTVAVRRGQRRVVRVISREQGQIGLKTTIRRFVLAR